MLRHNRCHYEAPIISPLPSLQVTLVSWLYGVNNFLDNIEEMGMRLGVVMRVYWKVAWLVLTPLVLAVLIVWDLGRSGCSPVCRESCGGLIPYKILANKLGSPEEEQIPVIF